VFHGMQLVGGGSTGRQAYVDDVLRLSCLPSFFGCEHVNLSVVRLRRCVILIRNFITTPTLFNTRFE
jgi:hypothetical protein